MDPNTNNMIISSSPDDPVLPQSYDATPAKPARGKLIAIIAAIIILVGGVAALLLVGRGSESGDSSQPAVEVSASAKTLFLQYANYVLYGKESDDKISGTYDKLKVYAITDAIIGHDKSFLTEAQKKLTAYYNSRKVDESSDVGDPLILSQLDKIEFTSWYMANGSLDTDTLITNGDIDIDRYEKGTKSDNEYISEYSTLRKDQVILVKELFTLMPSACFVQEVSSECLQYSEDPTIQDAINKINEHETKIKYLEDDQKTAIARGVFEMKEVIK